MFDSVYINNKTKRSKKREEKKKGKFDGVPKRKTLGEERKKRKKNKKIEKQTAVPKRKILENMEKKREKDLGKKKRANACPAVSQNRRRTNTRKTQNKTRRHLSRSVQELKTH